MGWTDFEIKEKTQEGETKREYFQRVKFEKILTRKVKYFNDILSEELLKNQQYRIITNNALNAIVVLNSIINIYEVEEMFIAVYRMNLNAVQSLKKIVEQKKINTSIVLSSFFRDNKKYERWCHELMTFCEEKEHAKICFCNNHAKVFIAKTKCGKYIVFEGSGNLSDNARIEQYMYEENEQTYNFHKNWMQDVLNKS